MKVMSGLDDLVARYVSEQIGINVTRGTPFIGFAVYTEEDAFVAGVIVSNFRETDCEVSMAADTANWARKGVMRIIFEYIFVTAGCIRCTCIVANTAETKRTRRFLLGIGFVLEGNMRRAYDGQTDALIFGLLREDCRFLGVGIGDKRDGEEDRTSAAPGS